MCAVHQADGVEDAQETIGRIKFTAWHLIWPDL